MNLCQYESSVKICNLVGHEERENVKERERVRYIWVCVLYLGIMIL